MFLTSTDFRADAGVPLRLGFVSYRHLTDLARSVIDEYADRARIEIVEKSFDAALEVARDLERAGKVDAFVSAGSNASYLRGSLTVPVATIRVGGYDILVALQKARAFCERIAIVTHRRRIPEVDVVQTLLRVEVAQSTYETAEEAVARVRSMASRGFTVVVGPSLVVEAAEQMGLRGILAYSTAGVRQGLDEALELARIARLASHRYEHVDSILRSVQDAILAVDANDKITGVNPAMEGLLGQKANALLGRQAGAVADELSLAETLASGEVQTGHILRFRRADWIANRVPVRSRGLVTGAVLTVYDARRIKEAETSLRSGPAAARHASTRYVLADILGDSPSIERTRATASRFADADLTVLVSGESGTGKELLAQAIHNRSARAGSPFVAINCSALPETLLESELFGYEDGAFTGARKGGRAGLFEAAHRGTLFLDEIGDMPLALQTRLLRVLQERQITRLGSVGSIAIDVRIIAATHQPLEDLVRARRFRDDLFYRLNILRLRLDPLRMRREDIPSLARHFISEHFARRQLAVDTAEFLDRFGGALRACDWPGNVRELENVCERLAMLVTAYGSTHAIPQDVLEADCPELFPAAGPSMAASDPAHAVLSAIRAHGGDRAKACRALGISRTTLWRRMKAAGMRPDEPGR